MKKFLFIFIAIFGLFSSSSVAEAVRIVSGKENAKITIIAYESVTCSHCADFHKKIYPQRKKDFVDPGLVKIEFRHFPLDAAAFNASKIAQCNEQQSLEILESLYTNQKDWIRGKTVAELNDNLKKFINNNSIESKYIF